MKKYFFYAALAVALTASCQKAQKNSVEVDPLDDGAPVPVTLGTNVVSATVKGSGALANFSTTTELDIFAIDKTCTGALDQEASFLLFNAAINPTLGTSASGLSGSTGYTGIDAGVYYEGTKNYCFYGYYVDDIAHDKTDLACTADAITLGVSIDGQQDILLATTNEANDYSAALASDPQFKTNRVYSAYSARRNVKPNLVFEHQLSKLTFKLKTGNTIPTGTTVAFDKLGVVSLINGTLTIVGSPRGLVATGTYPTEPTPEAIAAAPVQELFLTPDSPLSMPATKDAELTGFDKNSIMVYPGDNNYYAKLYLTQTKNSDNTPVTSGFTIPAPTDGFKAGHEYVVTIVVYGLEAVVVDVTLTDWAEGGSVTIDSDAENPEWTYPGA